MTKTHNSEALTPEQVEFFTTLVRKGYSPERLAKLIERSKSGDEYRQTRGKAERLVARMTRAGEITKEDIALLQKKGLVSWYRSLPQNRRY